MISLILEVVIAVILSIFSYSYKWWLPVIIFPIVISFGNSVDSKEALEKNNERRILDVIIMITHISFIIVQSIIFYNNIGKWYGAVIGAVIAFLLRGFMTPKRWVNELISEKKR